MAPVTLVPYVCALFLVSNSKYSKTFLSYEIGDFFGAHLCKLRVMLRSLMQRRHTATILSEQNYI